MNELISLALYVIYMKSTEVTFLLVIRGVQVIDGHPQEKCIMGILLYEGLTDFWDIGLKFFTDINVTVIKG